MMVVCLKTLGGPRLAWRFSEVQKSASAESLTQGTCLQVLLVGLTQAFLMTFVGRKPAWRCQKVTSQREPGGGWKDLQLMR